MAERTEGAQVSVTDEHKMYYTLAAGSQIDTSTSYVRIPEPDNLLSVVCDGEEISISWRDLFNLLKWAYRQLGSRGADR